MNPTPPSNSAPVVVMRPADDRFHSQRDWLESWHSFSFGPHQDPNWMGFGPLRVINDDTIAVGRGFGMHPHRDMEIVTVMVEGELTHADSMGHSEVLRAGEVQRMSAGTGIVHSEINRSDRACRLLQLWIEPECRDIQPDYEQKRIAVGPSWTPLIDSDGESGVMKVAQSMRLWRAQPPEATQLALPPMNEGLLWIQVIEGSLALGGGKGLENPLRRGDGLGFLHGSTATHMLTSRSPDADVLLFAFP